MTDNKLNLLFVDDEQQILTSLNALFEKDYNVFTATNGPHALELISKNTIDIIISDQRMPEMLGIELLKCVKDLSPKTIPILMIGYADMDIAVKSLNNDEIFSFIEKPWNNAQFKHNIAIAAEHFLQLARTNPNQNQSVHKVNLLLIDESIDICAQIHRIFGHKYTVYCANNMDEAFFILKGQEIAVIITEHVLLEEEMNDFIKLLKDTNPLVVTIILSTQADPHLIVRFINEGKIFRYLPKPVDDKLLEININAALKRYAELKPDTSLLKSIQQIEKTNENQSSSIITRLMKNLRLLR
jgi:serine/threonine-protein kinase